MPVHHPVGLSASFLVFILNVPTNIVCSCLHAWRLQLAFLLSTRQWHPSREAEGGYSADVQLLSAREPALLECSKMFDCAAALSSMSDCSLAGLRFPWGCFHHFLFNIRSAYRNILICYGSCLTAILITHLCFRICNEHFFPLFSLVLKMVGMEIDFWEDYILPCILLSWLPDCETDYRTTAKTFIPAQVQHITKEPIQSFSSHDQRLIHTWFYITELT